jgi:hypothetical protein
LEVKRRAGKLHFRVDVLVVAFYGLAVHAVHIKDDRMEYPVTGYFLVKNGS